MLIEYPKIHNIFKFDANTKDFTRTYFDEEVEYLKDLPWYGTEKYDGMNIRVFYDGYDISFYGRSDKSELPKEVNDLLHSCFDKTTTIFEENFGDSEVILFLECYGGKIKASKKRNWYNSTEETLVGLDVMIDGKFLNRTKISEIFDLFSIPSIELIKFESLVQAIDYVENKSNRIEGEAYFEGLVLTPIYPLYIKGSRIIVKVKCSLFNKAELQRIEESIGEEDKEKPRKKKIHNLYILKINKNSIDKDVLHIQKDTFEKLNETKCSFDEIKLQDMVIIKCNEDKKIPFSVSKIDSEKGIVEVIAMKKSTN